MKYNCGTEVKLGDIVMFKEHAPGWESPSTEITVTSLFQDGHLDWVRTNSRPSGHGPWAFDFIRRAGAPSTPPTPPTPWLDGDGVFHGTPLFRRKAVGYDQAIECITLARTKANKVVGSYAGNRSPTRMACSALTVMENELRGYFRYLYDK